MAHQTFTDAVFIWNAVNLSTHVRAIHLDSTLSTVDDSNTMGTVAVKVLPLLEDYTLTVEFSQDFAGSQVDVTLAVDKQARTARAWEIRPLSSVVGATNPKWTGTGYITEYAAIDGAFGEVLGTRITIRPSVAGAVRATV